MTEYEKTVTLKDGRTALLRDLRPQDAEGAVRALKKMDTETRFLAREPGEFTMTVEEEAALIQNRVEAPEVFWIAAFLEGELVGLCSGDPQGARRRFRHRAVVAISLLEKACGLGLGTALLSACLDWYKGRGYEQAELVVAKKNTRAQGLYRKLGFVPCGEIPHAMKYADGTYDDEIMMVKSLSPV